MTTPEPPSYADPYAAPGPETPPLAGLGERLLARIVDWVVVLVPGGAIAAAVVLGGGIDNVYLFAVTLLFANLLGFVYEALLLGSRGGQTLGKKALGLRVARPADGAVPAGASCWIRSAVYWLPGALTSLCVPLLFSLLNVLWCTWDKPYRQCLHDKAARTVVVKAA